MKNQVLELLNKNTDYISGEYLSSKLEISRAAIWKHIKKLKEDGYVIESSTKKGYKLISCPCLIDPEYIKLKVNTKFIGKNIIYLNSCDSTNDVGKALENKSIMNGTLIISEEQLKGKGRLGRSFISPKFKGLWFSLVLTPTIEPIKVAPITQITAAAINLALKEHGVNTHIKWVNDIILNNKKIGGVLLDLSCELSLVEYIALGIGLNINLDKQDIPTDLVDKATSLKIETSIDHNRNDILISFLNNFEKLYLDYILNLSSEEALKICKENSITLGRELKIKTIQEEFYCTGYDISNEGNLIVQLADGSFKTLFSGEVTVRNSNGNYV